MFTYPIVSAGGIQLNTQSWFVYSTSTGLAYGTMTSAAGWSQIASVTGLSTVRGIGVSGNYILVGHDSGLLGLYYYDGTSTLQALNASFDGPGQTSSMTYQIRGDKKNPGHFFLSNYYGASHTNGGIGYVAVNGSNTLDEVDTYSDPAGAARYFNLNYFSSAPDKIGTRNDLIVATPDYLTAKLVVLEGGGAGGLTVRFESVDLNVGSQPVQTITDPLTNMLIMRFDIALYDIIRRVFDPVTNSIVGYGYQNNNAAWQTVNGWGLWNNKLLAYPTSGGTSGTVLVYDINSDATITLNKTETPGGAYSTCTSTYDVCPYTGIVQVVGTGNDSVLVTDLEHNLTTVQNTGAAVNANYFVGTETAWLSEPLQAL